MSNAVAKRTATIKLKPIAAVVVQIRGHLYDATTLQGRANKHRVHAGQKLLRAPSAHRSWRGGRCNYDLKACCRGCGVMDAGHERPAEKTSLDVAS
jgi:hypothetical protein